MEPRTLDVDIQEITNDPERLVERLADGLGYKMRVGFEGQDVILLEFMEGSWVKYQWQKANGASVLMCDGSELFVSQNSTTTLYSNDRLASAIFEAIKKQQ